MYLLTLSPFCNIIIKTHLIKNGDLIDDGARLPQGYTFEEIQTLQGFYSLAIRTM